MLKEGYYPLEGTHGFLFKKLPQDIHAEVKSVVDKIQSNFNEATPNNDKLVGQIDKEYLTQLPNKATQYIRHIVEEYNEANPLYIKNIFKLSESNPSLKYEGTVWVNFQEKYEYNPIHDHTGVFSFVIWHQIPFYKGDEIKYGAGKGKVPGSGHNGEFVFVFHNGLDLQNCLLGIDKTMEGYMAIFPSSLNHIVYPFYTSDDYRITLSGNISFQG